MQESDVETLTISPWLLAGLFFVVAFLYSAIGLGGGSSYTALLAIFGASPVAIPSLSLTLNVVVTSISGFNFIRKGHARAKLIAPFLLSSMPMAWLGGQLALPRLVFYSLLLLSLVIVTVRLYSPNETRWHFHFAPAMAILISLISGAMLGFIAGAVGIGGGIYLVPLILMLDLGTARQAAAVGAIFVWVNSLTGVVSRLEADRLQLEDIIPLLVAVIAGGVLGSSLGAGHFSARRIEQLLGIVLVIASLLLVQKIWLLL
jgi:hypothetical protein